ncbi:MAG: CoA-binding protein [Desulfatiglandaceae bacterium]
MVDSNSDNQDPFSRFFEPRNIAVIGSLKEGGFGGYVVIKSLLEAGYHGNIFPINPGYPEVLGVKSYPSVKDVLEPIDMALIMINARHVAAVMEECAQTGIRAVIVVADGFAERDAAGAKLQDEIVAMGKKQGIRIIGPNTAGIANTQNGLNPCPYDAGYYRFPKGPVAICAQSGMINPQAFAYPQMRFGVSKICDFGNKCDLDEADLLAYLEQDNTTQVISMYVESIRDGRRFLKMCERVSAQKPILVLKLGTTAAGAEASKSHTGSMAVDDAIFDAACAQAGVLRLQEFDELFELPKIFASQPLPRGNRFAMVSFTGGVGVVAADQGGRYGLEMTGLSSETAAALDEIFPGLGGNPVDLGPMIPMVKDFSLVYSKILKSVLDDGPVDALFNVLWADAHGNNTKAYLETYEALKGAAQKPVITWVYGPNPASILDLSEKVEELGFPVFSSPEQCVKALGLAAKYAAFRQSR